MCEACSLLTYFQWNMCQFHASLTEFWTIFMRCLLILVTMAGMSTTFSWVACSRAMSMAISVPVLPTPALHGEMVDLLFQICPSNNTHVITQCAFSNPSWPAVHQCGSPGELHLGLHSTEVVEDWTSILWNTMVRPGGKVELCHLHWIPSNLLTLHGDACMAETGMKCLNSNVNYTANVKLANTRYIALFPGSPHVQREIKRSSKQYWSWEGP